MHAAALDSLSLHTAISPSSPLGELATFVAELKFEDIPAAIVEKAKVHILDTIGAALAGTRSKEFALVSSTLPAGSAGQSSLWGTDRRVASREAALVNGVAAHAFELDDTGGCDHSGAVVLPALFAALPTTKASGRDLIVATVAGYEVGRRVLDATGGYDVHNGAGWHSTGTCGTLAAAAAVGRLWRLPPASLGNAIALATSFSSGLWAFIHDGTPAKKIHAGRAADGGVLAAELAQRGFLGPLKVFDEVWGGFFQSFNSRPGDLAQFTKGLGTDWKFELVSLKPYASCRGTHSAVDALSDLLEEFGSSPAEIEAISVKVSAMLMGMCGRKEVDRIAAAQMSLGYALAARCVFGDASLASYSNAKRHDDRIAAALKRIKLEVDPKMPPMDEPVVRIRLNDGRVGERQVPWPTGSKQRPMDQDDVVHKFVSLASMAIPRASVLNLRETIENLEAVTDCIEVDAMLATPASHYEIFE